MDRRNELLRAITRRHFFMQGGLSVGAMALASLLGNDRDAAAAALQSQDGAAPKPHFPPKARNVIYLFMSGGPSQLDLYDYKPRLSALDGQKVPDGFMKGERFAFIKGTLQLLGSPYTFKNCGRSGAPMSNLLPHLSEVADDIAIVKSMYSEQFNHAPAQLFANTEHQLPGRPSMGSWLSYGLGS